VQSIILNWFWNQLDTCGNGYSGKLISLSLTLVNAVPAFSFMLTNELATSHVPQLNAPVNWVQATSPITKPDSTHDLLDLVRSFPYQADKLSTFALRNVSRGEVLVFHLRCDCLLGVDQISEKFVKLASDNFSGPLTYIINCCINTSLFPKIWKTARVSPIPKVDYPVSVKDYRPVSILFSLSKIFERLVLN